LRRVRPERQTGSEKDEKSVENELTQKGIFDTMIKHLSNGGKRRREEVKPEETGRKGNRKKLKNGLTRDRAGDTM